MINFMQERHCFFVRTKTRVQFDVDRMHQLDIPDQHERFDSIEDSLESMSREIDRIENRTYERRSLLDWL